MASVGKAAPTREGALRTGPVVTSHKRLGSDRPALRQDGATVKSATVGRAAGAWAARRCGSERGSLQGRGGGVDLPKAECAAAA